ncbi:pentapeptide repeat-containing protein [Nonomuraea sp. NPDC050022]|uniref:pentapeptide repeat-containing protein n=1 Tax=unclassified Nonomuraea TaxID=2593643 RepID=UPI0033F02761
MTHNATPSTRHAITAPGNSANLSLRAPDIHAALRPSSAAGTRFEGQVLHLDCLVLPKANLPSAWRRDADLHFSDLTEATFVGSHLTRADLTGVRLAGRSWPTRSSTRPTCATRP